MLTYLFFIELGNLELKNIKNKFNIELKNIKKINIILI